MFKIIAISCLMVTIAISLKKVDGQYVYKPALIQKESVINSQSLEHIKVNVENTLIGYIKGLKDVEASCATVNHDAQEVVQQVSSILNSCLKKTNETSVIESGIQNITNVANDLKKHIIEDFHEISKACFGGSYNVTLCYTTVKTNLQKISLDNLAVVGVSYLLKFYPFKLITFLPTVLVCYNDLSNQFTPQYLKEIYHDLTNCTQSIEHLFGA